MSKYTTQLRYICETLAGYTEPQDFSKVDEIIDEARKTIFNFDYDFDADYKQIIERKILKHYYLYEINAETFGQWLLQFQTAMQEQSEYYSVMHNYLKEYAEKLFDSVSYTEALTKTGNQSKVGNTDLAKENTTKGSSSGTDSNTKHETVTGSNSETTKNNDKSTGNSNVKEEGTDSFTKWDYSSDTPQGGVSALEGLKYLTEAEQHTNNEHTSGNTYTTYTDQVTKEQTISGSDKDITDGSENKTRKNEYSYSGNAKETKKQNDEIKTTEEYIKKIAGKNSNSTYLDDLAKLRKEFVNVDVAFINGLRNNFLLLW